MIEGNVNGNNVIYPNQNYYVSENLINTTPVSENIKINSWAASIM